MWFESSQRPAFVHYSLVPSCAISLSSVRQIHTHTVSDSLAVTISTRYYIASFFHIIRFTLAVVAVVVHLAQYGVSLVPSYIYIYQFYPRITAYVWRRSCRFASYAVYLAFSQLLSHSQRTLSILFGSTNKCTIVNVLYIVRTASHQYHPSVCVCVRWFSVNDFFGRLCSALRAATRNDIFVRHFQSVNGTRCQ